MKPFFAIVVAFAAFCAFAEESLPKVWMSTQWRDPFEETIRACAEQGVDVVEVPTWSTNHCAYALAALRKYKVKGFTSCGFDPSEDVRNIVREGKPFERAVFNGGVYLGQAIDRALYSFSARQHDIVIEPPVYSARQPYNRNGVREGHYMSSYVPTGEAEIIVPEDLFDGKPHLRIIPCKVLPVEPGMVPENDTVKPDMSGPEIENRRLVRLRFDLTGCADMMLDKVGIAVYWTSDTEGASWKKGVGQLSVFSKHTRDAARECGAWRASQWTKVNGGTFPSDDIIAIRFGDECFNLTGWVDCRAGSFPIWGFSPSGRVAFAAAAPGLVQPRTWGFPEVYGAEAYGHALYVYHKACAEVTRAFVEGVRSVSPTLKVFRNTTRGGAWDESNEHDGTGQELLTRELDFVHLDPYPLSKAYNSEYIPFDMGYMSGLARRYNKPIIPWMQAHAYAPGGLVNVTPADMKRMWAQHLPFALDGMMWLGFDMKPDKTDTEMTFPKGAPESWAYAKELFAEVHAAPSAQKPKATLAVLRPYTVRATCCAKGAVWTGWRNPADKMLQAYVQAWSVDNGLFYDVFELPPTQTEAERATLAAELKKYPHIVSTIPWPDARVIGEETEGTVMRAKELAAWRKRFAAEIAELKALHAAVFNVRDFGAVGDGIAKDTVAVQKAVDAANAAGGGEVLLPKGTYLCGSVFLKSGVDFHLAEGAVLKGSPDHADYNDVGIAPQNWGRLGAGDNVSGGHLILCIEQENVTLRGPGKIDGNVGAFLKMPDGSHPQSKLKIPWRPAQMVWFVESRNVAIRDIELADAPYWSCFVYGCEDVVVERANIHTVRNPHTYNGDGLDIDSSRRVRVTGCNISTADDSITLRAAGTGYLKKDGPCADVMVSDCTFSSDCNAIRLGVGNGTIRDCSFRNIKIVNTRYAVNAVGAWSRPDHGVDISRISFDNMELEAKGFCKFYYKHATHSVFDDISFRHVKGKVREPSIFDDRPARPFRNLRFEDVLIDGETSRRVIGL